jgi:hypothetical protein
MSRTPPQLRAGKTVGCFSLRWQSHRMRREGVGKAAVHAQRARWKSPLFSPLSAPINSKPTQKETRYALARGPPVLIGPLSHTAPLQFIPPEAYLPWPFEAWAVQPHHHGPVWRLSCPRESSEITIEVILCKYSRQPYIAFWLRWESM